MRPYGGRPGRGSFDLEDYESGTDNAEYMRLLHLYIVSGNTATPRVNATNSALWAVSNFLKAVSDVLSATDRGSSRPLFLRPSHGDRSGQRRNIGDNHRPGGYRLASDLQSLNLNGEFHRDGSYQRQFGGPPIPRQPVPRPDTPEPNAPAVPRPPSRPTSPRPSTPEPRPNPSGGGSDENRFTTWVLRLDTNQHKCVDAHLFRQPFSPDPIILEDDSILQPRGTVVLPIKPEPRHHYNLDISVMTISNVLYTPSERNSELSWPVLEKQGFELKEVRPADATLPIAMPREFTRVRLHAIQHPNLPGVHLLYASRLDGDHNRLSILPVNVDTKRWRRGVESGVLGTAVDMEGTLGWTEASEHSRFEEIVLGQNRRRLGIDRLEGGDDITTVLH